LGTLTDFGYNDIFFYDNFNLLHPMIANGTAATATNRMVDMPLTVLRNESLTATINILVLEAPEIAASFKPGQFMEIKTSEGLFPLLRRPFSIHRVVGSEIEIMSKVVGIGTERIYHAKVGDQLPTLAPLGNWFGYDKNDFDTALLISGGIGVAPMALLEESLKARGKSVLNFIGARTKEDIITRELSNCQIATDDGSAGFKGNIVGLLNAEFSKFIGKRLRVFACGPNRMLAAVADFCNAHNINCEVSIESTMGCGIGICYGCPIQVKGDAGEVHHKLLCQYGSVIDAREILFEE
jgi:dihydroorotate dehydrogenase electron transfer subunit